MIKCILMKRYFLLSLLVMLALHSCNKKAEVEIGISCPDLKDSSLLYLSRLSVNRMIPMDTFAVKSGKASISVRYDSKDPEFMYISSDDGIMSAFVASAGDNIRIAPDKAATGTYKAEGNDETVLMQTVLRMQQRFEGKTDSLNRLYVNPDNSDKESERLMAEISGVYVDYKRSAIEFMARNPKSITAVPLLYARVFGDNPLFGVSSDFVYFKNAYENLKERYPASVYVKYLKGDMDEVARSMKMEEHLNKITELSFPEISLYDIEGVERKLSDLKGKVILLSFWLASDDAMKMYNLELAKIYDRYNASGMEIYQVGMDPDKNQWASVVKSQNLSWISVNDPNGVESIYPALYGLKDLPSLFVINRNGDIVARDVFDIDGLDKLIRTLL